MTKTTMITRLFANVVNTVLTIRRFYIKYIEQKAQLLLLRLPIVLIAGSDIFAVRHTVAYSYRPLSGIVMVRMMSRSGG